jgi:hypothetical protein
MGDVTGGAGQGIGTAVAGTATAAATVAAATLDYKAAQEANAAALKQRDDAQKFIEQQTNQARGDIFQLFPAAQQARQQGIQSGFNLYKAALPTQTQYFQQGNIQAQNQQLAGLGQIQNAILGRPINQGALKAGNVGQMDYNAYGGLERFRPGSTPLLQPSGSAFKMPVVNTGGAPVVNTPAVNTAVNNPAVTTAPGTDYSIPSGTNGGGIQQYPTYVPDDPNWQYTPEGMAYYGYAG